MEPYRQPIARLRAGVARREITPPVGIFSRCWGAAHHEAAEGVHRPFFATALALEPLDRASPKPQVLLSIDLGWLEPQETEEMLARFRAAGALEGAQLLTLLSHTHAGANLSRSVVDRPGTELIRPYFDQMVDSACEAVREALDHTEPGWMTFGAGRCDLAVNRDTWDEEFGEYVCGFNPDATADDTVMVGRVSRDDGSVLATLVNYSCHPTSLGPGNRLLSPDYIGAMREIVESSVGGLCLFALGASAETTPRESYSAEVAVADRNGRQLGFAAASGGPSVGLRMDFRLCRFRAAVVDTARRRVTQNPIGSGNPLELLLGTRVPAIGVRMELLGKSAVSRPDIAGRRVLRNTEHTVVQGQDVGSRFPVFHHS